MSVADATDLQGAKIALISGNAILAYLRDAIGHIPNPNQWDLPGGVREADETALECALRETMEEFGIYVSRNSIVYEATYVAEAAGNLPDREVAFFASFVSEDTVAAIRFGEEGQCWRMMPIEEFMIRTDVVSELQGAFQAFWDRNACNRT